MSASVSPMMSLYQITGIAELSYCDSSGNDLARNVMNGLGKLLNYLCSCASKSRRIVNWQKHGPLGRVNGYSVFLDAFIRLLFALRALFR